MRARKFHKYVGATTFRIFANGWIVLASAILLNSNFPLVHTLGVITISFWLISLAIVFLYLIFLLGHSHTTKTRIMEIVLRR